MASAAHQLQDEPIGLDADERLDRAELLAAFEEACRQPVPPYSEFTLRRAFQRKRAA